MKTYKIAVVAGDGVGPEVIAEAVKVLRAGYRGQGNRQSAGQHLDSLTDAGLLRLRGVGRQDRRQHRKTA